MPAVLSQLDIAKGMVTATGTLAVPSSSMLYAQNFDFPAPGLAAKRPGVQSTNFGFGGACWGVISTKALGSNLLFNVGNSTAGTSLQYGTGDTARTALTTPDSTNFTNTGSVGRMRAAVSLKNHFLTSERYIGRLESDYSLKWAGMGRSPGMFRAAGTTLTANGAWLTAGSGVAYRTVWVVKDADGVPRLSPPSGRFVVSNIATTTGYTGATRGVTLRCLLPKHSDTASTAITTSYYLQVYRSIMTTVSTTQPNDELQLCWQGSIAAGDITNGYIDIQDWCPESALGPYLYTNTISGGDITTGLVAPGTTGLGIGASNDRPPLAKDVAQYADCLWYANVQTPQRLILSIVALGAGGLAVGDTLTIGGRSYTGVAGAPAGTQFIVQTGLASTSLNIRETAGNLVETINADASQTSVWATYIGSDASPGTIGQILLEARRTDTSAFTFATSGAAVGFLPAQASQTSACDTWGNGLAVSKPQQGDAVPPVNYLRVGRNDTTILRVMPLRDALFIFTDDGIYWARGSLPSNFVIDAFDTTFRLKCPGSVVTCGDAIYAWGWEGIARITNGGVEYIDTPVRNFVKYVVEQGQGTQPVTNFEQRVFAVSYRVQRKVVFYYPSALETGSYACCRALVFNLNTGAWSTYSYDPNSDGANGKLAGVVRVSDEQLHLGEWSTGTDTLLYREDYKSGTGYGYYDTSSANSSVNIVSYIDFNNVCDSPSKLAHWAELQVYYSQQTLTGYNAPPSGIPTSLTVTASADHGGSVSCSVLTPATTNTRVMMAPAVGIAARIAVQLYHDTQEYVALAGCALVYTPISTNVTR